MNIKDLPPKYQQQALEKLQKAENQSKNHDSGEKYRIVVSGYAQPKQRARVNTKTGVAYTPSATKSYEKRVGDTWTAKYGITLLEGPLRMVVHIGKKVPKSDSGKLREKKLRGEIKPTIKPDCSNIVKSIEDGLNGIAYLDDSQIVQLLVRKDYDEEDFAIVEVEKL